MARVTQRMIFSIVAQKYNVTCISSKFTFTFEIGIKDLHQ